MRLSDRVSAKIQAGIDALPILQVERDKVDYECIPVAVPDPAGSDEMLTSFYVTIFAPTVRDLNDHVTFGALLHDPYLDQASVNRLVADIWEKVEKDQDTQRKAASKLTGGPAPKMSQGGLIVG